MVTPCAVAFPVLITLYKRPMNDEQVEEIKCHFGLVTEAIRSDIHQIADEHSGVRHELQEIRDEFRDEFKEMRALILRGEI